MFYVSDTIHYMSMNLNLQVNATFNIGPLFQNLFEFSLKAHNFSQRITTAHLNSERIETKFRSIIQNHSLVTSSQFPRFSQSRVVRRRISARIK